MHEHQMTYPWDDWLNRAMFSLTRHEHFDCMPHSMAQMVRNVAAKKNKRVSITIEEDTIAVRVFDKTKPTKKRKKAG
jgi:hypothetical protein